MALASSAGVSAMSACFVVVLRRFASTSLRVVLGSGMWNAVYVVAAGAPISAYICRCMPWLTPRGSAVFPFASPFPVL